MMQGELEVWSDKKKDRLPRQVFLYETCFLLCKKKRDELSQAADDHVYSFKLSIQVSCTVSSHVSAGSVVCRLHFRYQRNRSKVNKITWRCFRPDCRAMLVTCGFDV